jgi:hypothetical protein
MFGVGGGRSESNSRVPPLLFFPAGLPVGRLRRSRHNLRACHSHTHTLSPRSCVNIPGGLPSRARDPLPIRHSLLEDIRVQGTMQSPGTLHEASTLRLKRDMQW